MKAIAKIKLAVILMMAPAAALAITPNMAEACLKCSDTIPHQCITAPFEGFANCSILPNHQCSLGGTCIPLTGDDSVPPDDGDFK